ncbi:MFS transporter [Thermosipho ferrireducens]|uniref:MFS transporter n=1 Tax=Thermosipho ferrireducens TaxID=2571116 RepID=A0ABX7S5H2_9BACT|nr:MFS transporter [Thermosipho ferrireducens]QTA37789.1 MFS transporter [Thermosipho ferrireducens]
MFEKDIQFRKFQMYGFLKNLRFFEPFLILFFLESGLTYFQIGILFSVKSITTNLLEVPTGIIADVYGRRKSMLFSMGSYIIAFLIFYFFPVFHLYIFAMILYAFGEAFRTGTHKAMILDYLKIKNMENLKVQYYGATRAASQFGSALNSLIAATIVFYSGNYRVIFFAAIVPYIFNFINLATYPAQLDGTLSKKTKKATLKDFINAVVNIRVLRILLNTSSYSAVFKSLKDYLQPILEAFALSLPVFLFWEDKKRSAVVIGIVYFILYFLTSIASKNSWRVNQRLKHPSKALNTTLIAGALIITAAGFAYKINLSILSIIFFILLHVLENIRRPISVAYVSDNVESTAMASVLSVESQFTTFLTAIFSLIAGYLADKFGLPSAIMIVGLILLSLSMILRIKPSTSK